MNTIWKAPLEITDAQLVKMPFPFTILHVGLDPQGQLCLWAKVNTSARMMTRRVNIVGTGSPCEDTGQHYGSVVVGQFVWHVFARAAH